MLSLSTTLTLSSQRLVTKSDRPSGLTATPKGRRPTPTVATTARSSVSTTSTESVFSHTTYSRLPSGASARFTGDM